MHRIVKLILLLIFISPISVFASVVASQTDASGTGGLTINNPVFSTFTTAGGIVDTITVRAQTPSNSHFITFLVRNASNVTICQTTGTIDNGDLNGLDVDTTFDLVGAITTEPCFLSPGTPYYVSANRTQASNAGYQYRTNSAGTQMYYILNSSASSATSTYSSIYNTRFTDLTTSGSSGNVTLTATHFVDPAELDNSNPQRNVTQIRFSHALRPSTTQTTQSELISSLSGTATTSTTFTPLADGTYDVLVTFGNLNTTFGATPPFRESYIYATVQVASGTPTIIGEIERYDNTQLKVTERECGLAHIDGCLINWSLALFVPSEASLQSLTSIVSSSSIPFVQYAYSSYSQITNAVDTASSTQATSSIGVNLTVEGAGLDVNLFSVERLTEAMGPSNVALLRGIAEVALYLGFLVMIARSVDNLIRIRAKA